MSKSSISVGSESIGGPSKQTNTLATRVSSFLQTRRPLKTSPCLSVWTVFVSVSSEEGIAYSFDASTGKFGGGGGGGG